ALQRQIHKLTEEISDLRQQLAQAERGTAAYTKAQKTLEKKEAVLATAQEEALRWAAENFEQLSDTEKNLFRRAFRTNHEDPDFHHLDQLTYTDEAGRSQTLTVPKGDILHA